MRERIVPKNQSQLRDLRYGHSLNLTQEVDMGNVFRKNLRSGMKVEEAHRRAVEKVANSTRHRDSGVGMTKAEQSTQGCPPVR